MLEGATALDPRGAVDFQVITVIPPLMGGVSGMDGASFAASWPLRDMEETIAQETTKNIRERVAAFGIEPEQVITRIGRPALEIRAQAKGVGRRSDRDWLTWSAWSVRHDARIYRQWSDSRLPM